MPLRCRRRGCRPPRPERYPAPKSVLPIAWEIGLIVHRSDRPVGMLPAARIGAAEADALRRRHCCGSTRLAEARAVDRALAIAASGGVTWWAAELHRIRTAVIRAAGGGDVAVLEALSHAVAIADQQGSETFRRRAAADMGAT
jgi:hypothetical protein